MPALTARIALFKRLRSQLECNAHKSRSVRIPPDTSCCVHPCTALEMPCDTSTYAISDAACGTHPQAIRHAVLHAGSAAHACAALLAWVDIPTSVRSALLGAALLAAAHELLAVAAKQLLPSVVSQGQAIARRQSRVTEDGDAPKAGVM